MFWKAVDDSFKMSKSSNQKVYQNTSKIELKLKKSISRNFFLGFWQNANAIISASRQATVNLKYVLKSS